MGDQRAKHVAIPTNVLRAFSERARLSGWVPRDLLEQLMRDYLAKGIGPDPKPEGGPWVDGPMPTIEHDVVVLVSGMGTRDVYYYVWRVRADREQESRDRHGVRTLYRPGDALEVAWRMAGTAGRVYLSTLHPNRWARVRDARASAEALRALRRSSTDAHSPGSRTSGSPRADAR